MSVNILIPIMTMKLLYARPAVNMDIHVSCACFVYFCICLDEGGESGKLNMHGVFLHILGDALGSVIVIINAIVNIVAQGDSEAEVQDPKDGLLGCNATVNGTAKSETLASYLDPSLGFVIALIPA